MASTFQARPDAAVILPAHLNRPLTGNQRAVLAHLAVTGHLVAPMARDYVAAGRLAGYKTARPGALVRDLKSSPHFQRARNWLLGACAELDRRPMDRAEAGLVLAEVARGGNARERLAAVAQLRAMGGWDMTPDGHGGTALATVGGFAASILAADRDLARLNATPVIPLQPAKDEDNQG